MLIGSKPHDPLSDKPSPAIINHLEDDHVVPTEPLQEDGTFDSKMVPSSAPVSESDYQPPVVIPSENPESQAPDSNQNLV
jgi:hypothetical protein